MNRRRIALIVLLACAIGFFIPRAGSQPPTPPPPEIFCKHFLHGYPLGTPPSNDLIIRDCYALSSNDTAKFAHWVCCYLTWHEVDGDLDLERNWRNDPWLDPSETLEGKPTNQDDYRGQKEYDRGHLAPLACFKGSRFASQVNYYSNIVPQHPDLNRGPWEELEAKTKADSLVTRDEALVAPLARAAFPQRDVCSDTARAAQPTVTATA